MDITASWKQLSRVSYKINTQLLSYNLSPSTTPTYDPSVVPVVLCNPLLNLQYNAGTCTAIASCNYITTALYCKDGNTPLLCKSNFVWGKTYPFKLRYNNQFL